MPLGRGSIAEPAPGCPRHPGNESRGRDGRFVDRRRFAPRLSSMDRHVSRSWEATQDGLLGELDEQRLENFEGSATSFFLQQILGSVPHRLTPGSV